MRGTIGRCWRVRLQMLRAKRNDKGISPRASLKRRGEDAMGGYQVATPITLANRRVVDAKTSLMLYDLVTHTGCARPLSPEIVEVLSHDKWEPSSFMPFYFSLLYRSLFPQSSNLLSW